MEAPVVHSGELWQLRLHRLELAPRAGVRGKGFGTGPRTAPGLRAMRASVSSVASSVDWLGATRTPATPTSQLPH
jgi:hypothetical protein